MPFNPDATTRDRLNYWVALERSVPGRMHLHPVFDGHDTIVDFRCAVASPAVARLLNESSGEAVGQRLSTLLATQENPAAILMAYIVAANSGEPCCIVSVSREGERIQHRLSVSPRFVIEAELRDQTAREQARGAFSRLKSAVPG